jgi:hypothetical protein
MAVRFFSHLKVRNLAQLISDGTKVRKIPQLVPSREQRRDKIESTPENFVGGFVAATQRLKQTNFMKRDAG